MLALAGKYCDVRAAAGQAAVPHTFHIGKARKRRNPIAVRDLIHAELRDGRMLHQMLERERWKTEERLRATARAVQHLKPNPKSDFRLLAKVDGRTYQRWKQTDPDFWKDDNNLRSLRRDNDALRHCIHV